MRNKRLEVTMPVIAMTTVVAWYTPRRESKKQYREHRQCQKLPLISFLVTSVRINLLQTLYQLDVGALR